MSAAWKPDSWRAKPVQQMAEYPKEEAAKVFDKLGKLPPLVQPAEVDRLQQVLAAAAAGERFIVQGGDCAERFMDCEAERLEKQLKLLLQMGAIVTQSTGLPSVNIARIAGQYGKPRSKPTEVHPEKGEIMSFKGDNINGYDVSERKWDCKRLLEGYYHSSATLNYLRGLCTAGDLSSMTQLKVDALGNADFTKVAQAISAQKPSADFAEFFTSHEGMQLDLEEALTRPVGDKFYNLSTHMLWIGDRTRQLDGGHVEYFRGIANPVGCKVGPSMKNDELKELVQILNPNKVEGKLVLITRYGAAKVEGMLPGHIEAVQASGVPVVWQCDGVHGNTVTAKGSGLKTRALADVLSECSQAVAIHKRCGSILGGVHLELTGQETVTECVGGAIGEDMLPNNYETYCDPRLNYMQAIEAAFKISSAVQANPPTKKARAS
eukprot:Transcript_18626.p2 GENE.Transcript_18626~~Transcript_18626.p2  ORF type:complete len:435 (+),score=242.68 Transcript_18626:199-1503(+)